MYLWLYWSILWVDWYGDTCIEMEVEEANNEREKQNLMVEETKTKNNANASLKH